MNPIRFLALPALAAAIVSCAPQKDSYDTSNPYGTPDGGRAANAPYQAGDVANPVYDTPAAYEDGGAAVIDPAGVAPVMPAGASSAAAATGTAATAHVVVKGDTLSGIANKYKVPMASIKKANNMTKDIVVLGKTLIIPAH
ncbi:MAG: LysM peptidoglycan-binding domain-containing protein [Akkermansiaceae bacterium]|nr:LysM peptidoglycan-binding domain-containing protein [Akkermansiaceae bacterium]MCF7732470.1 LysM peptidoglycan-binding domain-containing protein [Akkermansiaceae bacterium]